MTDRPDPRRVARLAVPQPLREGQLAHHQVQVLDLSPLGARLSHEALVHDGVVCYLLLPPALGALRVTGRIAWTRLRGTEQTLDGERRSHYESGIEFTSLTPEQRAALADVVETLPSKDVSDRRPSDPDSVPPEEAQR